MATTFYCGSFIDREPKNWSKSRLPFSRPRGGLKTATRALVKELVPLNGTFAAAALATTAALGVLSRLEVTNVNFIFLLFAHITFLSCVFGFGLCQSRRIVAVPLRPSRPGLGRPSGSAYLSNASAVEHHAPQNLRPSFPSTNSRRPINTKHAMEFPHAVSYSINGEYCYAKLFLSKLLFVYV